MQGFAPVVNVLFYKGPLSFFKQAYSMEFGNRL